MPTTTPTTAPTALPSAEFDLFYATHLADVVALLCTFTGSVADAQDLAQEAFCRAWERWPHVSRMENPGGWVRRVAVNLAHSRWRRMRTAAAFLRKQRIEPIEPLEPDHLALLDEVRALNPNQRKAIVLHHLLDLPVGEVASELGVAVGTVKSWLHRGRAALAVRLADSPGGDVRARAERRRNITRTATAALAAVAVAAVAVGVVVAAQALRGPVPPADSPSPAPTASAVPTGEPLPSYPPPSPVPVTTVAPDDPMRSVDWTTATINLTGLPDGCPEGPVRIVPIGQDHPRAIYDPSTVALGDLTGDGRAEAAMEVSCFADAEDSGDGARYLLAVERREDGSLHSLGWTGRPGALVTSAWITGGVLYAEIHPWYEVWDYQLGEVFAWRWEDGGFAEVDTSVAYPPIVPSGQGRQLDLSPVSDQLSCRGQELPASVRPAFDESGTAVADGLEWRLLAGTPQTSPYWVPLDRPAQPYLLLPVGCAPAEEHAELDVALVLFDISTDGWRALAAITGLVVDGEVLISYYASGDTVEVSAGDGESVTYRWTGSAFTPA